MLSKKLRWNRFIEEPKRILELGAGTGLLSYYWYQQLPASDDMLKTTEKRFAGIGNVSCQISDSIKRLPAGGFDVIVSALPVHHLEHTQKAVQRMRGRSGSQNAVRMRIQRCQVCILMDSLNKYHI